jgi:organic radical activating enzyme
MKSHYCPEEKGEVQYDGQCNWCGEKEDGISLNSMAHPVTNSPEPSYQIDPNKLKTIEVDIKMNAYELADFIETGGENIDRKELANMLRQQAEKLNKYKLRNQEQIKRIAELEKENDALKMGFANSGTSDSELAETRALANRKILEINELKERIAELEKQIKESFNKENPVKEVFNSEPVAWFEQDENMKSVWYQADKHDLNAIPLYTTPQKYCPSENNAAYEKGFIEGMAKQRDSSVDKWVNATTPQTKPLSDEEIMDFVDAFGLDMGNVYEFQPKKIVEMIRAIEAKVRGEK